MMNRTFGFVSCLIFGFLGTSSGCSSAQATCDLVCECEHCGDALRDFTCFQYEALEAETDAYECSDPWEAYVTCIQEKGTCDEKEARFSTRESGTCSDTQDFGASCMTNADCDMLGFPDPLTCVNNVCAYKVCSGSAKSCASDAECTGIGPDLCDTEQEAVSDCIDKASGGAAPKLF